MLVILPQYTEDYTINVNVMYGSQCLERRIENRHYMVTSGRLHSEFVRLLFLQVHRETDRFFADSGVQLP